MEHNPQTMIYLTVQDILWIHLQVFKSVPTFRYAPLEAAVNAQYAYGESKDPVAQAGSFLSTFSASKPLDAGSEATAFVACFAFLLLNGMKPTLPDAEGENWFQKVRSEAVRAEKAVEMAVDPAPGHGPDSVGSAVADVLSRFPSTIAALSAPVAV